MAFYGAVFGATMMLVLVVSMAQFLTDTGIRRAGPLGQWKWDPFIRTPVEDSESDENSGTRWAVLVAGSNGWGNYRHQADVCHAYQLLKKGGLRDENIIVMMFDDIAMNPMNPRRGTIINQPNGGDVYAGVPKDYTGDHVNAQNLFAVLLGDENAVKGGSGKVVNSTVNDRVFIYYSDHGGPGVLGMPNNPFLLARDFIEVLKKKHASRTYKEMVIYLEACESGSIFEGLMPENLNIYVSTASNAQESSYAAYCPGPGSGIPTNLPCLGDLYSVAWMEDSESHNLKLETIEQQFEKVKQRTTSSHVMEYGDKKIHFEKLYLFQGFNPATVNLLPNNNDTDAHMFVVNQRNADLFFLWEKYKRTDESSEEKAKLLEEITKTMLHRAHLDGSMQTIETLLFGHGRIPSVFNFVRKPGQPIVDDWECLKSMVRIFETHCGSLTQYGMKLMRAFANICNNGIRKDAMEKACKVACSGHYLGQWNPWNSGFSA